MYIVVRKDVLPTSRLAFVRTVTMERTSLQVWIEGMGVWMHFDH